MLATTGNAPAANFTINLGDQDDSLTFGLASTTNGVTNVNIQGETGSDTVTLNDLTITHGFALEQAGGILNQGSNLTLSADVLSQNVAFGSATTAGRGGGLRSRGGTLTITGCTITGNQALGGTSVFGEAVGGGIEIDAARRCGEVDHQRRFRQARQHMFANDARRHGREQQIEPRRKLRQVC